MHWSSHDRICEVFWPEIIMKQQAALVILRIYTKLSKELVSRLDLL